MKKQKDEINYEITTMSNVLIGGADQGYRIGGIDKSTILDHSGKPIITASSFKGTVRKIMTDGIVDGTKDICKIIETYMKTYLPLIKDSEIKKNFEKQIGVISAGDLLGIKDFDIIPKVLFSDAVLTDGQADVFSTDTKNSITQSDTRVEANPRTYQTICRGIRFAGKIQFLNYHKYGEDEEFILAYIKSCLTVFNEGIYRLGNSKSRGYGKIMIKI